MLMSKYLQVRRIAIGIGGLCLSMGTGVGWPGAVQATPEVAKKAAEAARQAGEPPMQEILDHLGYSVDVANDEIDVERFVKSDPGDVTFQPIAAFGLPKVCTGGWYLSGNENPEKKTLWKVGEKDNKRYDPPIMPDGKTTFDPGKATFGVWVATAGFPTETIFSEDALQKVDTRFKANDRHKAHAFPVKKNGKLVPNSYIIGWEYSTNNDDQDMVTLISNVQPAGK